MLPTKPQTKSKPTRRQILGGLLGGAAPHVLRSQAPGKPPNVVFIISDQMRGDAMSFVGSPCARTPNLDKLAGRGISFDNYFSNSPVCTPSRKCFFSGRYPHEHGSLTNRHGEMLALPGAMIDYFKQRGYRTGYVGKNHAYKNEVFKSVDVARLRDREPFRKYNRFVPPEWHADTYWPAEECYAWLNTADALRFIDGARDNNPFFLTVSYFDPHPPYMAPPEYTSKYRSDQMKIPPYIAPSALSGRLDDFARAMKADKIKDAALTETMRYYYAAIEGMVDHQVGRIMAALSGKGLLENTIVVFTADHGDFMGQHRLVRKGMFLYDCLLHVPMIWNAPGLRGGRRSKTLAQGIDYFPTLVDLTGGKAPDGLAGRSLKPFFSGASDPAGHAIFTSASYGELSRELVETNKVASEDAETPLHTLAEETSSGSGNRYSMMRTREWKFLLSESRPPELYRMNDGWVERENLADRPEHAPVRRQMEQRLRAFWRW
ncbi:MAG TPA: sulfatase-like hydrolase/transferase [Bryobacteraceae bacterium]|nr:sulfatase-like hydrolase/transferase [Bryobacteraceae bacterium]